MQFNMSIGRQLFSPLLSLLFFVLLTCTFTPIAARDANLEKLATANNVFALNLHRVLSTDTDDNVFFSPLSLATVLSMLYYGVRGQSAKELRQTLGYNDADLPDESIHYSFHQLLKMISNSSEKGYELDSANTILVNDHLHLLPEYKRNVQDLYMCPVRSVDFGSNSQQIKESVNEWVESKTSGMIKKLLEEVHPSTILIMLNAVYFKGTWQNAFDKWYTRKDNFYNAGSSGPKEVDMMKMYRSWFPYHEDRYFKAIELPYEGGELSMLLLLPSSDIGLSSLKKNLTASKLRDIRRKMWSAKISLLTLPKFKLEFEKDNLVPELRKLGLEGIFNRGSDDFSGMMDGSDSRRFSVSYVVHKSKVEVNEEGTRAAAATALGVTVVSGSMGPIYNFKADRPFLFFIIEKVTGLILFMGRVSQL